MTTTKTETKFPVNSFREAAEHLRRPFSPGAVKFKVQNNIGGNPPRKALIVCYIDARSAVERLNLVVPHLWTEEYKQVDGNHHICHLTIDGLTRSDVGASNAGGFADPMKSQYSDALKRAAVKFGVGVSLYAMPIIVLSPETKDSPLNLKTKRTKQGETKVFEISDAGLVKLRGLYQTWLDSQGSDAFGAPLDHGDPEEGSVGDPVDPEVGEPEQITLEDPVDEKRFAEQKVIAQSLFDKAQANGGAKSMKPGALKALMSAAKTNEDMDAVIERVKKEVQA